MVTITFVLGLLLQDLTAAHGPLRGSNKGSESDSRKNAESEEREEKPDWQKNGQNGIHVLPKAPERVEMLPEDEFAKLQSSTMSLQMAQAHFHSMFPPWSDQRRKLNRSCPDKDADEYDSESLPRVIEVQQAYHSTNSDEISVLEGDAVKVVERTGRGWSYGYILDAKGSTCNATRQSGWFPDWVAPVHAEDHPESRRLQGSDSRPLRAIRFVKAIAKASAPLPSVAACLNLGLDLSFIGLPGVFLRIGIEGELYYNPCNMCYQWKFTAEMAFGVRLKIFGAGIGFQFILLGQLDLKELICDMAKDADFCRYLYSILPEHANRLLNKNGRCHSDSPFELLTAYIKYQWVGLHEWLQYNFYSPMGVKTPSDLASHLQVLDKLNKYPNIFRTASVPAPSVPDPNRILTPQKVDSIDNRAGNKYIWMAALEARLCWSSKKPSEAQGGDRDQDSMAELFRACEESITMYDVTEPSADIQVYGQTVTIKTRRDNTGVKIKFNGASAAQSWHANLMNFLSTLKASSKSLLVTKCMRGQVTRNEGQYIGLPQPYCTLVVPGQQWSSSYQSASSTWPFWKEGVGLRVDSPTDGGATSAEIVVRVHDMDASVLERWIDWVKKTLSDYHPMAEYLGIARVTVCDQLIPSRWTQISDEMSCDSNGDGVNVDGYVILPLDSTLAVCKNRCEIYPGCKGVDLIQYPDRKQCNLYVQMCSKPEGQTGNFRETHRLDKLGCSFVQSRGKAPGTFELKLLMRKDHGDSWNFWNWHKGVEILEAGWITLEFEWEPQDATSASTWFKSSAPVPSGATCEDTPGWSTFDTTPVGCGSYANCLGNDASDATAAALFNRFPAATCDGARQSLLEFNGTVDDCVYKCFELNCMGFERTTSTSVTDPGTCIFFVTIRGTPTPAPGVADSKDCFTRNVPISLATLFTQTDGHSCDGNGIDVFVDFFGSADECMQKCMEVAGCLGFELDTAEGSCDLRGGSSLNSLQSTTARKDCYARKFRPVEHLSLGPLANFPEKHCCACGGSKQEPQMLPGLVDTTQAMFAGLDQFLSKMPEYSKQVLSRLEPFDKDNPDYEDATIDYTNLDGRFFARWDERNYEKYYLEEGQQHFFSTTQAPLVADGSYTCPAPDNAGTMQRIYCELQRIKGSSNKFEVYLADTLNRLLQNPPCKGWAAGGAHDVDDRVVHFHRAINQSTFASNPATVVSFYAELATSMLNLFVRSMQDIHALWSTYFAWDTSWNGECASLIPEFDLPYEFGFDFTEGNDRLWQARSQDKTLRYWPTKQAKGTVSQPAAHDLPNSHNPFCNHSWASGRKWQEHRIDFIKQDPPINGRDGYVTPARDFSSTVKPLLWCEMLKKFRESGGPALEEHMGGVRDYVDGATLRYESSCRQLAIVKSEVTSPSTTAEEDLTSVHWSRYDCETADLSSSFTNMFPSLINHVMGKVKPLGAPLDELGFYGRLGTIVEDVLQCAGRISPGMRQFRRRPRCTSPRTPSNCAMEINELCDGTEQQLEILVEQSSQEFKDIVRFIKLQTNEAMVVLKEFVDSLGRDSVDQQMTKDFQRLFMYRDLQDKSASRLYGKALFHGVENTLQMFSDEAAILRMIEDYKRRAVGATRARLGKRESASALFPMPLQIRTLRQLQITMDTIDYRLCNKGVPQQLTFALRDIEQGTNFENQGVVATSKCILGTLAPLKMIAIGLTVEGCWTKLDGEEDLFETQWRFGFKAVVSETTESLIERLVSLAALIASSARGGHLQLSTVSRASQDIGWHFARRVLLDPQLLLTGVGAIGAAVTGAGATAVAPLLLEVGASIQRNIAYLAADLGAIALSAVGEIWERNPFFDLESKNLRVLSGEVILKRVEPQVGEAGPWATSFGVRYFNRGSLGLRLSVPFFSSIRTDVSMTSNYDLSEVFNIILDTINQPSTYYDCCMSCLQEPATVYCRDSSDVPMCIDSKNFRDPTPLFEQTVNATCTTDTTVGPASFVGNADSCMHQCLEVGDCVGFRRVASDGTCDFYSGQLSGPTTSEGEDCFQRKHQTSLAPLFVLSSDHQCGTVVPGTLQLEYDYGGSAEQCMQKCLTVTGGPCVAFEFAKDANTCNIYGGTMSQQNTPSASHDCYTLLAKCENPVRDITSCDDQGVNHDRAGAYELPYRYSDTKACQVARAANITSFR